MQCKMQFCRFRYLSVWNYGNKSSKMQFQLIKLKKTNSMKKKPAKSEFKRRTNFPPALGEKQVSAVVVRS